ncbi:methionyl-tRNA formyltransferase [Zooshikella harenae]|uniref:Methionyl-tRNA formyltransferase n=1 Tax=Zooshikella harenae TaxID=2827238 RepID=A0ABS5ZCB9_9GAMM|nr:methionyl-tRNA formyltransferase [Zooshikella harenae]MBU2711701.1 methionyl-tRNA formyltransferase [Zooshikella harenae]
MSQSPLTVVFAGTPDFAAAHLVTLLNSEHQIVAVYSQPDRPAGRGRKVTMSPVKALAQQQQIPVYQPKTLRDPDAQAELATLKPDVMVVVAYGLILPQAVLDIPRLGCINVHASLLPRWRGAAPIERALLAGDQKTGVTIMQMDAGLDTGDMLVKAECPITQTDTSADLYQRITALGAQTLPDALSSLAQASLSPEKQDNNQATYAEKISKAEAEINWQQAAEVIHRQIRGFNPRPIAYSYVNGEAVRIWSAELEANTHQAEPGTILATNKHGITVACLHNAIRITKLQLAGAKAMSAQDILNSRGHLFTINQQFTSTQTL